MTNIRSIEAAAPVLAQTEGAGLEFCDHCRKRTAKYTKTPKTYDFSFKHAMARLGVPLKTTEVDFQNISYYFENEEELRTFLSRHPDIWVTKWYTLCPNCFKNRRLAGDSLDRILNWLDNRLGNGTVDEIIAKELVPHLPELLESNRDKLKKELRKETRLNWRLGL